MIKIALTGASGLVGSRIIELLKDDFQFIDLPQKNLDITNKIQCHQVINEIDFDVFLHLAAYTNVDGAENQRDLARKINVEGTKNVFAEVNKKNKKFIYISTGFVFDGENPPYNEDSQPKPKSVYATTKYEAEEIVKNQAMIVRIEYPYRAKYDLKFDFVATVKKLLSENRAINMVTDNLITPTFIDDISYGLKYLFNNFQPSIFHLVGADSLSPFYAGLTIAKIFNLNKDLIKPITAEEYFKNKAVRPKLAVIKTINNNFYKMKTFKEGLLETKSQILNSKFQINPKY